MPAAEKMSHGHFLKAFREFGLVVRLRAVETPLGLSLPLPSGQPRLLPSPPRHLQGTFKKLYKMRTLKFGTLMGEDALGNKYYENTKVRAATRRGGRARALGAPRHPARPAASPMLRTPRRTTR